MSDPKVISAEVFVRADKKDSDALVRVTCGLEDGKKFSDFYGADSLFAAERLVKLLVQDNPVTKG